MPPPNRLAADIADVLRNPYQPNHFQTPYSSHYASAYMQSQPALYTTPEGYTLSSTYNPRAPAYNSPSVRGSNTQSFGRGRGRGRGQGHRPQTGSTPHQYAQRSTSSYNMGNARCTYQGCSFTSSPKSVEIHMMDRHLIYPPGWEKHKKMSDWDADPSLKGKPVPIQGTSVILDDPEMLDAWLAERRKRFPTAQRVEEKNTRLEEAIARGQLPPMGSNLRGKKRRYEEEQDSQRRGKRFNNYEMNRKPGPRTQLMTSVETRTAPLPSPTGTASSVVPGPVAQSSREEKIKDDDNDNDDETPEVLSSKKPISPDNAIADVATGTEEKAAEISKTSQTAFKIPKRKEPRLAPRNPFASRPALLRNLLLPEIRMTVSNLSQAIRFIVDNDFLRDVELKPGQANNGLIEVLDSAALTNDPQD
ncbi:hypothetical protein AGABI2DRAFT_239532 [Agaricus bisporus var. bisporus H97]|uniref:hypothetical protein n=1 Tax=Agaricus bisporus var. bisporus (strain H97 / ATCC MYA-4626 / FGSC 10389) TaxID=936046 RepID=UPI00029F7938|nr:hypothetical protein AGABI2DRAFT_239532 [Agaricus bisporus var. bisporus H97]EKV52032.1 hypothetical protein AGABI2DRAFT_239532 [Agaricus bisporus var. bisporus H97]